MMRIEKTHHISCDVKTLFSVKDILVEIIFYFFLNLFLIEYNFFFFI